MVDHEQGLQGNSSINSLLIVVISLSKSNQVVNTCLLLDSRNVLRGGSWGAKSKDQYTVTDKPPLIFLRLSDSILQLIKRGCPWTDRSSLLLTDPPNSGCSFQSTQLFSREFNPWVAFHDKLRHSHRETLHNRLSDACYSLSKMNWDMSNFDDPKLGGWGP
jgi:hypothetical protein